MIRGNVSLPQRIQSAGRAAEGPTTAIAYSQDVLMIRPQGSTLQLRAGPETYTLHVIYS